MNSQDVKLFSDFVAFMLEKQFEGLSIKAGIIDVVRATERATQVIPNFEMDTGAGNLIVMTVCRELGLVK